MNRALLTLAASTLLVSACGSVGDAVPPVPVAGEEVVTEGPEPTDPERPVEEGADRESPVVVDDRAAEPVQQLVAAANAGDPLGMLAALDPAERELLSRLYTTGVEAAEEQWPQFDAASAWPALEPFLGIDTLTVEPLGDDLAWVSTDSIVADLHAPNAVAASFFWSAGPWTRDWGAEVSIDEVYIWNEDHSPGVIVVEIDGEWRVSLVRTLAELVRRGFDVEPSFGPASPLGSPEAASPAEAVRGLFGAVDAQAWSEARSFLVPAEAAAFADYEPSLGAWLTRATADGAGWSISAGDLTVVAEQDDRAVVELSSFHLVADGDFGADPEDGPVELGSGPPALEVEIDGTCGRLTDETGCVLESEPWNGLVLLRGLTEIGWKGPRVATVRVDGQWRVSLYETVLLWSEPLVAEPLLTVSRLPVWNAPAPWILLDEASKQLDAIGPGQSGPLELLAEGRVAMAVLATGSDPARLRLDGSGLGDESCLVSLWLQDLAAQDFSEGPDYWEWGPCAASTGLELPTDATVVVYLVGHGGAEVIASTVP